VIAAWVEGLKGMKEGGTRKLTVPAELGYGERGFGDKIPPNANLVFEIELLEVLNRE
jgi:peptidylprolyl isomerase